MLESDATFAVEKKGFRYAPNTVVNANPCCGIPTVLVGNAKLVDKRPGIRLLVLDIDPDERNLAFLICFPGGFQNRRFVPTGRAPGRPEIDQYRPAAEFLKPNSSAVKEHQVKRRRLPTDERRADIARIACEAECQKPDERYRQPNHDCQAADLFNPHPAFSTA